MIEGSLSYLNISAPAEQKVNVQPSEEPVFILNSSQLEAIIQKATESLKTEVSQLQAIVSNLEGQISALVSIEFQDVERLALDIAHDRQRLTKLEKVEPQPLQQDRSEILRALLAANNGKMLAKDARQKMHLSESRFSELLNLMDDYIEIKPFHLRKNQNMLILR